MPMTFRRPKKIGRLEARSSRNTVRREQAAGNPFNVERAVITVRFVLFTY